ncbi:MAG: HK97 family phage prohead protease [Proteobacteria bacterium]|nr:HK97 family phage prohead protease [Pseudomonadota bacterium]
MAENLQDDSGRPIKIVGYANLFDTSITRDGQTLEFARGAFLPTLSRGAPDLRATVDHKRDATWASVRDGSLTVWEDACGLAFSALLAPTPEGRGHARAVADGLIFASIRHRTFKTETTASGCIVKAAVLIDICLTTSPAYPTATWLVPFDCNNHMSDNALMLRRRWIGGQLKARREARDHVTQPRVAPAKAELAVKAHQEANARRPPHTRAPRRAGGAAVVKTAGPRLPNKMKPKILIPTTDEIEFILDQGAGFVTA